MKATKSIMVLVSAITLTGSIGFSQTKTTPTPIKTQSIFTKAQYKQTTLLLSAHHALPDKSNFLKVSTNVDDLLYKIAMNKTTFEYHRVRALEALGHFFKDPRAFALYGTMLAAKTTPEGTKHRLMFMSTQYYGEKGLVHLNAFMNHKDLQFRWTAATAALKVKQSKTARKMLNARLTREKHVTLLNKLRIELGEIK